MSFSRNPPPACAFSNVARIKRSIITVSNCVIDAIEDVHTNHLQFIPKRKVCLELDFKAFITSCAKRKGQTDEVAGGWA